jgi:hypothetical protein
LKVRRPGRTSTRLSHGFAVFNNLLVQQVNEKRWRAKPRWALLGKLHITWHLFRNDREDLSVTQSSSGKDATPSNPRGIPYAPFVDKVEDYVASRDDVEPTLRSFQEMIS